MFKNYLIIAIRNLLRQKGYSIINITGLAIGLAAFILIVLHIIDELNYDRFHKNADNIYRVCINGIISGDVFDVAVSAPPTGQAMVRDIPEITNSVRLNEVSQTVFFSNEHRKFYEDGMIYVDSTFFDIFSFRMIMGNPETALDEPFNLVLTESVTKKYFGEENPIGKTIMLNDKHNFVITGVIEDPPTNSHFTFKILSPYSTFLDIYNIREPQDWGSLNTYTYVLLAPGSNITNVEARFPEFMNKNIGGLAEMESIKFEPYLQPITSIHLYSNLMAELQPNSDINYVYTFLAIAVFILLIACINFMNLSTARSIKRAREVGLRKVVGAHRKQLVIQFISESFILCFIGLLFALILVEIALPTFNHLLDKNFILKDYFHWRYLGYLILLTVIVGLIAGSYPAFYLSAFQPIKVLKGILGSGTKKSAIRNVLVIVQFSISIFLIISTGFVYNQLQYLRQKKLGFDKENVVVIPLRGERLQLKAETIKAELKSLSCVESVSSSQFIPGGDMNGTGYIPEGMDENAPWIIYTNAVDFDYVKSMGMEVVNGRDFSRKYSTDSLSILINETLAKKLGWEEPIGKKISGFHSDSVYNLNIIGIVKDFHFRSLHDVIEPSLMLIDQDNARFLNIRLHPGNIGQNLEILHEKWQEMEGSFPFDYFFLDEDLDQLYKAEIRVGETFIYFTVIAILIACLGLFGLASFNAEQKTKEIGIRKALGSSVQRIVIMLSKQFSKWVIIANVISWPVAFYFIDNWLGNFAYSLNIIDKWYIFLVSGLLALIIALLTVSYQAIKAAITNPVDAIKYE